jgi:hypothetical protein
MESEFNLSHLIDLDILKRYKQDEKELKFVFV